MEKDLGLVLALAAMFFGGLGAWSYASAAVPADASPAPSVSIVATARPSLTPKPTTMVATPNPTATPAPAREPVDVDLASNPKAVFISEVDKSWCAASAVQIVLNLQGPEIDRTKALQTRIHNLQVEATDWDDSHNGGAGPNGIVSSLNELGSVTYELRIYKTRAAALRASAVAISATGSPVILMAWRGAHSWVMTGYVADADPTQFADATVEGTYILDPWYPRVSSIWGASDPPGTYQDTAEMRRNYLPWRRPEGKYPGRDGRYLVIIPADAPAG